MTPTQRSSTQPLQSTAAQRQPYEPAVPCDATGMRVADVRRMESNDTLRFLEAKNVETPAGRLNDFVLVSPTDAKLGTLDGVVVSPHERQVRYYVVKTGGWFGRRYLLPATPARKRAGPR